RVDSVKRRYPQRTRRASGAAVPDLSHVYVFELARDADVLAAARAYASDRHVEYATPDWIFTADATPLPSGVIPDDPFLEDPANPGYWREGSWGQPVQDLWGLRRIRAVEAWNLLADPLNDPGNGVLVAVVDSGLDRFHPDIAANAWTNPGEVPGNGIDDDGNGFVDDLVGWDFTTVSHGCHLGKSPDNDPFDDNGHGTHVAGTIAAIGNNGAGIVGVAPRARILGIKGLDDTGCGALSELAAGVVYAADNGADVLNMSWGGGASPPLIEDALGYAHGLGAVMVASAGNSSVDTFGPYDPAPMNSEFVITVSAFDPDDQIEFFSNFGQKIDVAAPGGGPNVAPPAFKPHWNILSLLSSGSSFDVLATVGGQYLRLAGTSMSAPHVSGLAALVLGNHPGFSNEDVRQVLHVSADDVGPAGFDPQAGYGRINAERALGVTSVPTVFITSPASRGRVLRAAPIPIVGTAGGPGFESYEVLLGAGNPPAPLVPLAPPSTTPVTNGTLVTWDASDAGQYPAGFYTLVLRVIDDQARVFESRRTILLYRPPAADALAGWPIFDADPIGYVHSVAAGDIGFGAGTEVVTQGFNLVQGWSDHGQLLFTVELPTPLGAAVSLGNLDADPALEIVATSGAGIHVIDDGVAQLIAGDFAAWTHPVVLDDLDGDGLLELISTDLDGRVWVRHADGTPYSPAWPMQPVTPLCEVGVQASDIATGDLDGDGEKEIVVSLVPTVSSCTPETPTAPRVLYALGLDGTVRWTFTTPFAYTANALQQDQDVVIGDVDRDGEPEVVFVADGRSAIQQPHYAIVLDRNGNEQISWTMPEDDGSFVPGRQPRITLTDLDRDGDLEIVFTQWLNLVTPEDFVPPHVSAWHHTGVPVAGFPAYLAEAVLDPAAADVDGDGGADLVTSLSPLRNGGFNRLYALGSTGALLFSWPRDLASLDPYWNGPAKGALIPTTELVDLDGNGSLDLIAPIGTSEVHAVDLGVPVALDALDWPTYRHDVGRTGRFEFSHCGNGTLEAGEDCDDGNRRPCDGCSITCHPDVVNPCGNGVASAACGEECDDGNADPADGCTNECTACGNGIVTYPERCDGSADCCAPTCQFAASGSACTDDGLACTADVCDASGTCLHTPIPNCTDDSIVGIETTVLRIRDGTRRSVSFVSRPAPGGPAFLTPDGTGPDDPRYAGGFIRFYNSAPGGAADDFGVVLEPEGWTASNTGFPVRYRYRRTDRGKPILKVDVRSNKLTVKGGGPSFLYTLDEPSQGRVAMRLQLGNHPPWCADAPARAIGEPPSTARYDTVNRFEAEPHTPAPAVCP
ncbi:MAG TPA: S8 family serine peptidase, partial [Candidatus Binatia bacterium]|nr:S8 family serine peptidase [Candidatus Binatia bacterium]